MEQKPNRVKYNVGYKKLKNVDLFEDFAATNAANEGTGFGPNWKDELQSVWYDLNIMNYLLDEGHLGLDGGLVNGVSYTDLNRDLEEDMGTKDFFDSDDSVEAWVVNTMENLRQFANKH